MRTVADPYQTRLELSRVIAGARTRQLRSQRDFAEQEIIYPSGEFEGDRFRVGTQPYTRHWFDAVDSGDYTWHIGLGPSQSGKTFCCWVLPIMWHLFEYKESVIAAVPDHNMVGDKWRDDLKPVIEESRYRDCLPIRGQGSRAGRDIQVIEFRHGPELRFLTGGGGDKSRAGKTGRVMAITELDGFDEQFETSTETTKIGQLEARLMSYSAFEGRQRIYAEGTVTIEQGYTWNNFDVLSTRTELVLCCKRCKDWVLPGRDQLVGWQAAKTVKQAGRNARFSCPSCGIKWTEEMRRWSLDRCRAVHKGQSIERTLRGKTIGERPETNRFALRWSAVQNKLLKTGDFGMFEWTAQRSPDSDSEERKLRQFIYALPFAQMDTEIRRIDPVAVNNRRADWTKGVLPPDVEWVCIGLDMGKRECWWTGICSLPNGSCHIFDYGYLSPNWRELDLATALFEALDGFRQTLLDVGWAVHGTTQRRIADQIFIDAGWEDDVVKAWCAEQDQRRYKAVFGRGEGQHHRRKYIRPRQTSKRIFWIGEQMHAAREVLGYSPNRHHRVQQAAKRHCVVMELNADHFKSRVHERLIMADLKPGCLTLFADHDPNAHSKFCRMLAAEHFEDQFDKKLGVISKWIRDRKRNHTLDSTYMGLAAATFCGCDIITANAPQPAEEQSPNEPERHSSREPRDRSNFLGGRRGWIARR